MGIGGQNLGTMMGRRSFEPCADLVFWLLGGDGARSRGKSLTGVPVSPRKSSVLVSPMSYVYYVHFTCNTYKGRNISLLPNRISEIDPVLIFGISSFETLPNNRDPYWYLLTVTTIMELHTMTSHNIHC